MILPRRHALAGALAAAALIRATPSNAQSMLVELDPNQAAGAPPPIVADGQPPTGTLTRATLADALPPWRRNAVVTPVLDGRPAITLVIDDMGWMHRYTDQAVALPGPLTLAWFPFAQKLPEQVAAAAARGHEAMLHMPMQSHSDSTRQTGPDPLRIDLPPNVNQALLREAIAAVPAIVGVNNHMGTVATLDPLLMELVAREVHDHGMLFL